MKKTFIIVLLCIAMVAAYSCIATGTVVTDAPIHILRNTPGAIPIEAIGAMDHADPACGVWKGKWDDYGQPITVVITKTSIAYGVEPFTNTEGKAVKPGYMVFDRAPFPVALNWKRPNNDRVFTVTLDAPQNGVIEGRWRKEGGGWDTATLRK